MYLCVVRIGQWLNEGVPIVLVIVHMVTKSCQDYFALPFHLPISLGMVSCYTQLPCTEVCTERGKELARKLCSIVH